MSLPTLFNSTFSKCLHFSKLVITSFKSSIKIIVVKSRKVLAFTRGAVKKVFVSLEMCSHLLKEL
jgi:hypothetical protein